MRAKWIYGFWGGMDFIYICWFCYLNFSMGKVPFYSDMRAFSQLGMQHGIVSVMLLLLSFLLHLSIIVSMILFFRKTGASLYLVYAQTPFRFLFVTSSLPFVTELAKTVGVTSVEILVALLVLSEVVKVGSVVLGKKLAGPGRRVTAKND